MNKAKLFAVMVPFVLISDFSHSAEIYNKYGTKVDLYAGVNARREFNDSGNYDKTLADIGFYGETKVSSKITGYGFWQTRITEGANEWSSYNGVRQEYAGLKMKDIGSLDYGRNFGILYDIGRYTDVAPYFSGETWNGNADNYFASRGSNMLTYRNENFFGKIRGLDFALQYQAKKEGYDVDKNNGEGYGASLGYEVLKGWKVTGVYSNSHRTDDQIAAEWQDRENAKAWGLGTVYYSNHLYLAALYANTENMTKLIFDNSSGSDYLATADKSKNLELVAQYQFDNGLRPSISYVKTKVEDKIAGNYDYAKYVQSGVIYKINSNVQVWLDHRFSLLDTDPGYFPVINDDRSAAGFIFMF